MRSRLVVAFLMGLATIGCGSEETSTPITTDRASEQSPTDPLLPPPEPEPTTSLPADVSPSTTAPIDDECSQTAIQNGLPYPNLGQPEMIVRVECSGDWATVLVQPPTDAPRFVLLLRRTDAGWVEDRRCDHHDVADIAACISDLPADVVDDLARIGVTYPLGEDDPDPSTWAAECAQPALRRGDSGLCVARLQTLLVHTSGAPIVIDGHFGPATEASLIAMQTNWGLEPDGYAGAATWAALIEAAAPRP